MTHAAALPVLRRLAGQVEDFLPRWTAAMDDAGYLSHTTAKREDCILSYRWFVEPILLAAEEGAEPTFGHLIRNKGQWADRIVQTSRRHRWRGITGDMFIGCFKMLVHCVEAMVREMETDPAATSAAQECIRLWSDALETVIIRDWTALSKQEADESLDQANRRLTMEKCKYENVIDSISDLVFVLDAEGIVLETNRTARQYFLESAEGQPVWELLRLEGRSITEVLQYYPVNTPQEISFDDSLYFQCVITPLQEVSLASDGYLAILNEVTAHVKQREILEATVAERTAALQEEKAQLQDMNVTLRTVMQTLDTEREAFQESVARTVRTTLLPALDTVRKERNQSIRDAYMDILEDQLLKLAPGGGRERRALMLKLTPTEMKVCQFIQSGASTKDIAEALNLSTVTIQTHRRNIRKKLDLHGKNVNLYTFLNHAG